MLFSAPAPDWRAEHHDWPHAEASRFVDADGIRFHVQIMGNGPVILLLHGTGSSTHSWRDLMPFLSSRFTVVAPDLPGHGFSETAPFNRATLNRIARAVAALTSALKCAPALVVGHSAGAAIAVRMVLDQLIDPRGVVAINGALFPYRGNAGMLFSALAQALFLNPIAPRIFAYGMQEPERVRQLISKTGSHIDSQGMAYYARLFRYPGHIAGALGMMAHWNLGPLAQSLHLLKTPLLVVAGEHDRAVPPAQMRAAAELAPAGRFVSIPNVGHLAHEESPATVAAIVKSFAAELKIIPLHTISSDLL